MAALALGVLCIGPPLALAGQVFRPNPGDELHPMVELMLRTPLHFAHRGGARDWPEHTLLAYQSAVLYAQTDVLELDVHYTADGVPVLIHDETVDRTTNGTGDVKFYTLAELKTLDAGYWFTRDGGQTYPYRGMGLTVPTLAEVLDLVADRGAFGGPTPWVNIELKVVDRRLEGVVADLIDARSLSDRICLGSFHSLSANHMKELLPDACSFYPVGAGVCFGIDTLADASLGGCPDFDVLEIPADLFEAPLGEKALAEADARGIPVVVWTVNDADDMDRFLELGVHGIMSDAALDLRRVMNDAGFPPNPASGY